MYIAKELRKKNIAEYLLYMWQVEDLLRAYDCSLGRIRREYIDRFDYTDEQKEEMADWYGDLIRMMNQEGCRLSGHLQINKIVMQQLEELNAELLDGTDHPFYTSEYYKVLPYIVELRRKNRGVRSVECGVSPLTPKGGNSGSDEGETKEESEIETCFNALYGMMMLRLQKKEVSPDTQHAIKEITTFIGMLNDEFMKVHSA